VAALLRVNLPDLAGEGGRAPVLPETVSTPNRTSGGLVRCFVPGLPLIRHIGFTLLAG